MKIDKKYFILADKEKTPPGREFALFVLYTLLVPFLFCLNLCASWFCGSCSC